VSYNLIQSASKASQWMGQETMNKPIAFEGGKKARSDIKLEWHFLSMFDWQYCPHCILKYGRLQ
jgi:hypothetical protein